MLTHVGRIGSEPRKGAGRTLAIALRAMPILLTAALVVPTSAHASMWADEVATWSAATRSWSGLHRLLGHQDGVFAAYYAAMHVWTSITGSGAFALRLPSVIACIATVAVTTRTTIRLTGSQWAGLGSGLWLATNPFFIFYGSNARPYAVVALLAALTTDMMLQPGRPGRRRLLLYTVAAVVGVYLHLFFGLLVLAHAAGLTAADRRKARWFVLPWSAIALSAAPLTALAVRQRFQISWIPRATAADYYTWWGHLVGHATLGSLAFGLLAVCGVMGRLLHQRGRVVLATSAVMGSLVLVTTSLWWPTYDSRYVIESAPSIAVLVGAGTLQVARATASRALPTWGPRYGWRPALATGVAVLSVAAATINAATAVAQQRRPFFYENLAAAAGQLRSAKGAGTAVIFLPAEARGALYYYLDGDQDGDLGLADVNASPGATPLVAANFSGLNRPLAQSLARAKGYRTVVLVELGATPTSVWNGLTAALGPAYRNTRKYFGAMTLVYFHRR